MTLSSLLWVCLGVWLAINCIIAVRLMRRSIRLENVGSASLHQLREIPNTGMHG
jgi:hypothetical protein